MDPQITQHRRLQASGVSDSSKSDFAAQMRIKCVISVSDTSNLTDKGLQMVANTTNTADTTNKATTVAGTKSGASSNPTGPNTMATSSNGAGNSPTANRIASSGSSPSAGGSGSGSPQAASSAVRSSVVEEKPRIAPAAQAKLDAAKVEQQKGKIAAIERAMSQIEKAYGKGSIMKLDGDSLTPIPAIPTGALSLDLALGGRGLPRGRVIEIFGPESSGKTTLALTVVANAQKTGGVAAFIDAEHALDPSWAKRIGVNLDEMLVSQPDTGEQALEICEMLVRSNAVDIIVIDSVAALIPKAEIEGEMGESQMGLQARLMSQALRKLTGAIAKSECIVIFINQLREKIGVMFGSPETTTGGKALKFYSSVRIDIRRIGAIKDGDRNVGNRVRAKVVKNKIAPPFREAEFDIMFNEGISTTGDLVDLAVEDNIIDKAGAWFSYKTTRIGQGRENAKAFIKENPAMFAEIRQRVIEKRLAANEAFAKGGRTPPPKDEAEGEDDE
jgi:recombination protein RecA